MNHKEKYLHHKELDLGCSVIITNGGSVTNYKLFVNFKGCKSLIKCKSLWQMIVKWVARKLEECNSFEIPLQDHEQYHAGRTKQRGGPRVAHVCSKQFC